MREPDRIIRLKTVLARTGPADGEHVAPLDPGGDKYENPMTKDFAAGAGADDCEPAQGGQAMTRRTTTMGNKTKLRHAIAQITVIDPVVAIELSAMTDCLTRAIAREEAAAATTQRAHAAEQDRHRVGLRSADAARQLVRLFARGHRGAGVACGGGS
jgi:hypothetical protein